MKKLLLIPLLVLTACTKNSVQVAEVDKNQKTSIIGGVDVATNEAYAQSTVALVSESYTGGPMTYCTGTLISRNLIVTAAHCADQLPDRPTKILFGTDLPKSLDDGRLVEIGEAVNNKNFARDPNTFVAVNDVAVIKLAQDAPEGFKPVPVLDNGYAIQPGDLLTLVGWGRTSEQYPIKPTVLQKTEVAVAAVRDMEVVTDQRNGSGACAGDSGGPAFIETAHGLVLAGATRGPEAGYTDCHHYGVYTLLVNHKDFLIYAAETMHGDYPQFVTPIK